MPYIADMTMTDYIYPENKEEEELQALKMALTHRYNNKMTTKKGTEED